MILDGKLIASKIKADVAERAKQLNRKPTLACVIVEGDSASEIYVSSKEKACHETGLNSRVVRLANNVTQAELEQTIYKLNMDKNVDAIIVQLPLPRHLDEVSAIEMISPEKDADCLTSFNFGRLAKGISSYAPCTASGIITMLDCYGIELEGKRAVVVGRSLLVGKSVAMLLEQRNATVTLCHSHTKHLAEITRQADILIVAIGNANYITAEYVKEGAVVVDVGINRIQGKLYGDVNFKNVEDKCSYITPVPGGVGPLTVASLLANTVALSEYSQQKYGQVLDQESKK